jgi:hypothetical protein
LPTDAEYLALAEEALAKLPEAKSDAERLRLKRASAAYRRLAAFGAEDAARAAAPKPRRIVPEKQPTIPGGTTVSGLIRRP